MTPGIRFTQLTDGGQTADSVAADIIEFIGAAQRTLDIALYDVRLPGEVGDHVADAIRAAAARGVAVRIAFNADGFFKIPVPPPPSTNPDILATLGVPLKAIPGEPDLMHHKYLVRDGSGLWCGSTNWTTDSWTREENIITQLDSPEICASYTRNFEELWTKGKVEDSGGWDTELVQVGDSLVRPWFSPGRGEKLAQRIAEAIGLAKTRVRIASPVLTSGPILGTLAEIGSENKVDVQGVCDWTQLHAVFGQWKLNTGSQWKIPLLAGVLETAHFNGKRSTPYGPGTTHDYMHAKITVADDISFVGSFNLSRSGEMNAENVLEIHDATLADELAQFIDKIRVRYPDVDAPGWATALKASAPANNPPAQ